MNTDKNIDKEKLIEIEKEFEQGIEDVRRFNPSVTIYGSTRIDENNPNYKKVEKLAERISKELGYSILSGGGPGIMEAANRGAFNAGGKSVGLTIRIPREQGTNKYVNHEIPFNYFFSRQASMSYSTEACIFCPGGFGTLSELFEILTLKQTKKIGDVPVILFISSFWNPLLNTINEVLLEKFGTIDSSDLNIFIVKDDEDEILEIIKNSKIRDGEDALL